MAPFPATCSVVLPMSAQDYLEERNSPAFRTLLSEVLDLGSTEEVASWDEGSIHFQEISTQPDYTRWVPQLVRKYVKPEDICFSDVTQYNPALLKQPPYKLPVTSTVPLLGDKMECERVNVIRDEGLSHCRLTVEGHIIVRLFGIGRLAERIIIESTHKTLRALPAIIERYNEMRKEFEMVEPPEDSFILSTVSLIAQRPYLEAVAFEDDSVTSTEVDDLDGLEPEQQHEDPDVSCECPSAFSRSDTVYLDAEEEKSWLDPDWTEALEEVSVVLKHDTQVTISAIDKDNRRAMLRIRKLTPSRVKSVILNHHPAAKQARGAARHSHTDTTDKRWRKFWRKVKPARPHVPSLPARAFHLLHLSAGMMLLGPAIYAGTQAKIAFGWIRLRKHNDSEESQSLQSSEGKKTHRGPKQLAKAALVKMHLRKGEPIRVTTPPAPKGMRNDVDLNHPDNLAARQGATSL